MAAVDQVADRHYQLQVALAAGVASQVGAVWDGMDVAELDRSWLAGAGARIVALVTAGQWLAAGQSEPYVAQVLAAQGIDPASAEALVPGALSGVASDGRDLSSLMYEPVITVKTQVKAGQTSRAATAAARIQLDMITRTQVADAGRVGDQVAMVHRKQVAGYVRLLVPPSCSRCVILAGRRYSWNAGFERHPRCDCRHIPTAEDEAGDLRTDPKAYFDSLSEAEQDRTFTKAGAQAIRDGADMAKVVNARRGMYTAGGKKYTTEGATRRGRRGTARLMPEQIYREAGNDRDEAIRLLRLHGYLR